MIVFSVQFAEQNSFEIEYKGKKVNAFYTFDRKGTYKLKFSFVSVNSLYSQAIVLHLDSFKGELSIGGQKIKKPKGRFPQLIFSKKHTPKQFELDVILQEGDIAICNGSIDAQVPEICRSLNGGCAMIIEEIEENHLRFYCNDYENDDDFDDLIFDLEIIKVK